MCSPPLGTPAGNIALKTLICVARPVGLEPGEREGGSRPVNYSERNLKDENRLAFRGDRNLWKACPRDE